MKYGWIFLCIIVTICATVKFGCTFADKFGMIKDRTNELIGVRYESSGSMNGERLYLKLAPDHDGNLIFSLEYSAPFQDIVKTLNFQAESNHLDSIKEIFRNRKDLILGKCKLSSIQELDGAVETVVFYLENQTISIDSMHELPEDTNKLLAEVKEALMNMIPES